MILNKHEFPERNILSTLLKPEENQFFLTEFSSTLNRMAQSILEMVSGQRKGPGVGD